MILSAMGEMIGSPLVMIKVCADDSLVPPLMLAPLLSALTVTVLVPFVLGAHVKVSVPAGLIAGWTENMFVSELVTANETVTDGLMFPVERTVAKLGTTCGLTLSTIGGAAASEKIGGWLIATTVKTNVLVA